MEAFLLLLVVFGVVVCAAVDHPPPRRASVRTDRSRPAPRPEPTRSERSREATWLPVRKGDGMKLVLPLPREPVHGDLSNRTWSAANRFAREGAIFTVARGRLEVVFPTWRLLGLRDQEALLRACELYAPATLVSEHPVKTGTLFLGAPSCGAARGTLEDLACLDGSARRALVRLGELQADVRIEGGRLSVCWSGYAKDRLLVSGRVTDLVDALARIPSRSSARIEALLRSGDRFWLAFSVRYADGRIGGDLLGILARDPEFRLLLALKQGSLEERVNALLDGRIPLELRLRADARIEAGTVDERCRAAARLAAVPAFRPRLAGWIGAARGEAAELAWIALSEHADDPELRRTVVDRLAEIGTRRCLPALHALQRRVGPLRFQLREQIARAVARVADRCGAAPGALSLASPPAGQGAVSVASAAGALARTSSETG